MESAEKFMPKLAFSLLKEAQNHEEIPKELLKQLHAVFGPTLISAADLLEKCKITKYQIKSGARNIYKVINQLQSYTIYEDINFCQCPDFQGDVLKGASLTCKHILAVKLINKSKVRTETVTDLQFADFLDAQINTDD